MLNSGHHLNRDVRHRRHFQQVAQLPGHDRRRAYAPVQGYLIDDEQRSRRIFPVEHALLASHPASEARGHDVVCRSRIGAQLRACVTLRLEQPGHDPRVPVAETGGLFLKF